MNYRDKAPEFFKDLNSAGIMSFFEDEREQVKKKRNGLKIF